MGSIALNTMVFVVEFLFLIRMIYGLTKTKLCNKLNIYEAIAEQTGDSKCCMFGWRVFELIWYIVIVQQMNYLDCHCTDSNVQIDWTNRGIFYQLSFYLDLIVMSCIFIYLLSKCLFIYLMMHMTSSAGAHYNMGAFFAGSSYDETTLSYWSPLKIGMTEQDTKYQVDTLKLHTKGWK